MKRFMFKSLLSMMLVVLLIFPAMGFASSGGNVTIKSVYFTDEEGRMVYVDYEQAIDDAMDGDETLYDAIREYVGIAEEKGRDLFIETNAGKVLNYKLAMIDGLFRLEEIVGNRKYEVGGSIEYTHELKVVNGEAEIVEKEDEPEPVDIVSIDPVRDITVEFGTSYDEAIDLLPETTTITDSEGFVHVVDLYWTIEDYDGDVEGEYLAIGTFELPEGIENNRGLRLEVTAKVKVVSEWPAAIDNIDIGESAITEKTYANINIKDEYVDEVEAVYVDNRLANQVEDAPFQWRIEVEEGTTESSLRGRIRVDLPESPEEPEPEIRATYRPLFIPTFGYISVEVNNVEGAAKFSVVYHLSDSEDGTVNIRETSIVNIGEEAGSLFYDPNQYNTVDIKVFDANENLLHIFEGVIPVV